MSAVPAAPLEDADDGAADDWSADVEGAGSRRRFEGAGVEGANLGAPVLSVPVSS